MPLDSKRPQPAATDVTRGCTDTAVFKDREDMNLPENATDLTEYLNASTV